LSASLLFVLAACTPASGVPAEPSEPISPAAQEIEPAVEVEAAVEDTPALSEVEVPALSEVEVAPTTPSPRPEVTILTTDNRSDRLRSLTSDWNTNWALHTIDYSEILSGGPPRDGIPSIDDPQFVSPSEAETWLAGNEPVIFLDVNGDARAYPLQILTWHEIVNDTVGGVPVIVTFCPLCNSALVFDRRVDGETYEFGTSGLLRYSDLIMYDRTTESLWQQFTGDAIVGDKVGTRLTFLSSSIISFADFKAAHPDGPVLSRETGYSRRYGENPYVGYDTVDQNPFLFTAPLDERLLPMTRVVTISLNEVDVAYPLEILAEAGVIHDTQGGQDLVIFHTGGTASALDSQVIADGKDVGATAVFDPTLDGQKLTFSKQGEQIGDAETGSTWNILGQAIDGPLAGKQLTPIVHADHFWFSWAAFRPDTIIYQQ
jgi:hypothetical protein